MTQSISFKSLFLTLAMPMTMSIPIAYAIPNLAQTLPEKIGTNSNVQSLSGQIYRKNNKVYLQEDRSAKNWNIVFKDSKNLEIANKLEEADFLSALGSPITAKEFLVQNIEYVGYRNLLGTWVSDDTMIEFQNFSSSIVMSSDFGKNSCNISTSQTFYYIITPSTSSSNQIFFSNNDQVISGTFSYSNDIMILDLFDQESGALQKHLLLRRISSR